MWNKQHLKNEEPRFGGIRMQSLPGNLQKSYRLCFSVEHEVSDLSQLYLDFKGLEEASDFRIIFYCFGATSKMTLILLFYDCLSLAQVNCCCIMGSLHRSLEFYGSCLKHQLCGQMEILISRIQRRIVNLCNRSSGMYFYRL